MTQKIGTPPLLALSTASLTLGRQARPPATQRGESGSRKSFCGWDVNVVKDLKLQFAWPSHFTCISMHISTDI